MLDLSRNALYGTIPYGVTGIQCNAVLEHNKFTGIF